MIKTKPAAKPRRYQYIVDHIKASIASGEYGPGTRLPPERELTKRFDVSRPTIREAMIALEAIGQVEVKTGSGIYVSNKLSPQAVNHDISAFELTEARVLIEGEAAALAASTISAHQLELLAAALDDMANENTKGKLESEIADRKFHAVISQATQNRALIRTIDQLWSAQENLPDIRLAHSSVCKTDGKKRLEEHQAIYDALEKRDSNMARTAMRTHFSRVIEALHHTAETKAVQELQQKVSERRERFSLTRLNRTEPPPGDL